MVWKIQSLFSGIGGLDLGVERALDSETIAHCELMEPAQKVLRRHWPKASIHGDVRTVAPVEGAQLIACGFPCQNASKTNPKHRQGIHGAKTGLWTYSASIISQVRPRMVVIENVRNLLNRGFDQVVRDLDLAGYNVRWGVWSVAATGGPHIRERLMVVGLRRGVSAADVPLIPQADAIRWDGLEDLPVQPLRHPTVPGGRGRLTALGNAVAPPMATQAIVRTIHAWNAPQLPLKRTPRGSLPAWGGLTNGELHGMEKLVEYADFKTAQPGEWVRYLDRSRLEESPPGVGRVVEHLPGAFRIEFPGGDVRDCPREHVTKWWPTPTAWDRKATGCPADYRRKSPNLPSFTGGVGCPELAEWAMGLPKGWTLPDGPSLIPTRKPVQLDLI